MYEKLDLFPNFLFNLLLSPLANNNKDIRNSTIYSTVLLIGIYAIYQYFYKVPEIDWQEFRTKYLGTDSVGRIEVINKNQVYIYPKVNSVFLVVS